MATATEKRNKATELMLSRKGKNSYTQGSKRGYFFGYPDNKVGNKSQKGYSDCSSAVRAAIKAAAGVDIGSNTSAQINNRKVKGLVVHTTDGYYPDESVLLPGDCLYFKGNASHPLEVGHVEMYVGDGKVCGHGSGTGPKVRDMKGYCKDRANSKKRYFMAIRWILDDKKTDEEPVELREGMFDNPYVLLLQQNLKTLGFSLDVDSDYGSETTNKVKEFQTKYGLDATGIADTATLAKINELLEDENDDDEDTERPEAAVDSGVTVEVTGASVNVRTGPGKKYTSLHIAHKGDKFTVPDIKDWTPIKYGGHTYWMKSCYLKKVGG